MKPLFKYVGGKRRMVSELNKVLPKEIKKYWEPMCGGAALFFDLVEAGKMKHAALSDKNSDLMLTYVEIQQNPQHVIDTLSFFIKEYMNRTDKDVMFYEQREFWNGGARFAARFIFLKQTAYNGLWRENSKGEANMPWGAYLKPSLPTPNAIRRCAEALKGVELETGDYRQFLDEMEEGEVVYFDPPYMSTFNAYEKDGFLREEHARLLIDCAKLSERGVKVILTNRDSVEMRGLIAKAWPTAQITEVMQTQSISGKADGRNIRMDLILRSDN